MGGWLDSSGVPIAIADVITVKTDRGRRASTVSCPGSMTAARLRCQRHVCVSDPRRRFRGARHVGRASDHPELGTADALPRVGRLFEWGNPFWRQRVAPQQPFGRGCHQGRRGYFLQEGRGVWRQCVLSGNSTALAIGGGGYGGGAIFLDGKGAVRFGKNAVIANNESYHYGGAIYSLGSVSMGEGAIVRGNTTSYMGGAIAVTGALSLEPVPLWNPTRPRRAELFTPLGR